LVARDADPCRIVIAISLQTAGGQGLLFASAGSRWFGE
jgi:hypothetical protein